MRCKPALPTLDRSDPLAPALALALAFPEKGGSTAFDLVSRRVVKWQANMAPANGPDGRSPNFASNAQYGFLSDASGSPINLPLAADFSVACAVTPSGAQAPFGRIVESDYQTGFFLGLDPGGTGYLLLVNTGGGTSGATGGAIATGVRNSLLATVNGTAVTPASTLYVDGALAGAASVTNPGATAKPLYLATASSLSGGPGVFGWLGQVHYLYIWSGRVLSQSGAARLANDPYSLARRRPEWLYAASAGGVNPSLLLSDAAMCGGLSGMGI